MKKIFILFVFFAVLQTYGYTQAKFLLNDREALCTHIDISSNGDISMISLSGTYSFPKKVFELTPSLGFGNGIDIKSWSIEAQPNIFLNKSLIVSPQIGFGESTYYLWDQKNKHSLTMDALMLGVEGSAAIPITTFLCFSPALSINWFSVESSIQKEKIFVVNVSFGTTVYFNENTAAGINLSAGGNEDMSSFDLDVFLLFQ